MHSAEPSTIPHGVGEHDELQLFSQLLDSQHAVTTDAKFAATWHHEPSTAWHHESLSPRPARPARQPSAGDQAKHIRMHAHARTRTPHAHARMHARMHARVYRCSNAHTGGMRAVWARQVSSSDEGSFCRMSVDGSAECLPQPNITLDILPPNLTLT